MRKLLLGCFTLFSISYSNNSIAQLNGTYTVGGVSPDYVDIITAVSNVFTVGVSGPVTFNIRAGYYSSNIGFGNFMFSDTITFQSESGNPDDVLFPFTFINNSRNIQFKNLSWNPVQPSSSSYLYKGMEVAGSFNILFENCKIIGLNNPLSRNAMSVLHSFGNLNIRNCSFSNLDNGISFSAVTFFGSRKHGGPHDIENCVFDSVKTAIRLSGEFGNSAGDSVMIIKNTVNYPENGMVLDGQYGWLAGIYLEKNNIINASVSGIKVQYSNIGSMYRPVSIRNNMISGGATVSAAYTSTSGTAYTPVKKTIEIFTSPNAIIENNSISGSVYIYLATEVIFKNNCVASDSLTSLYVAATPTFTSDYNNLYGKYNSIIGIIQSQGYPTIDSIRSDLGLEMNSISTEPFFFSSTDLHSYSPYMQFAGMPLLEIPDDIEDEVRDATTPDIGADEYHSSPLPPFAWFDFTCMSGNTIQFNNVSVRDNSSSWSFGDGNFSTTLSPTHTYSGSGPFNIVLIVSNSYGLDTFNYSITFATAPTINVAGSVLSVPATFTTYQWYLNGTAIFGATSNSYATTINGIYTLEVFQNTGCSVMSNPVTLNVGIEEALFNNGIFISPNPASDYFSISILNKYETIAITILDITGKEIIHTSESKKEKIEIDTKDLSQGVYFVQIQTDAFVEIRKIIITK